MSAVERVILTSPSILLAPVRQSATTLGWVGAVRGAVALLALAFVFASACRAGAQQAAGAELPSALRGYGLSPVSPPAAATDFELPTLDGQRMRLSDFSERWVVLTFFTTWCEPCVTELPTLQELSERVAELPVEVVGVSVDDAREPLDDYVEGLGLRFPVLWDESGNVGRFYRAHSIPISYVIDRQGNIVAVSRGSRDWSGLDDLFAQLEGVEAVAADAGGYRESGEPIALPTDLEPPEAEVALSTDRVRVGEEFELTVRVTWAGDFEDYILMPPEVELPEQVERLGISAQTSSTAGDSVVDYRVRLVSAASGVYALNPVGLRYTPRGESEPVSRRIPGPEIDVVAGGPPRAALAAAALAGVIALVLSTLWFSRRGRVDQAPDLRWQQIAELQQGLRQQRLEGRSKDAVLTMQAMLQVLEPAADAGELRDELAIWSERARFANEAPGSIELDRLQRRLERLIAERAPDTDSEQIALAQSSTTQ